MSWYNPYGWFGGRRAFAETIEASPDHGNYQFFIPPDSRHYLGQWSRWRLNQKAEWLWQNFGIVKEWVGGIARHTVGKGISLQIDSEDSEWNQLAEQDFENYALTPERCDLAGRRNFYEAQTTAVEQRIVRGEFFAALTENPEWGGSDKSGTFVPEPCFQIYDSEEIGNPYPLPDNFDAARTIDGVGMDGNSRTIVYYVRGVDGDYTPIPRAQMLHWYKAHSANQTRGITELAQAVNPLVDIHELKKLATRSAKAQLLLALALKGVDKKQQKGAIGAIRNAGVTSDGTPDPNSAQMESVVGAAGGGIIYLDDKDGDAKLITSNSPSPLVEGFITDLLIRDGSAAQGIPGEFFWNPDKLNGGNTRFILARADLTFQILGDGCAYRFSTPVAFRYLSHRIKIGALRPCKDPNWALKLSWQMPARISIDNGRENRILLELLANGMITLRQYCNERGINYKAVMRQWIREPKEFIELATAEGLDAEYIKRLKDNLPLWRAPAPGQGLMQQDGGTGSVPSTNAAASLHDAPKRIEILRDKDGNTIGAVTRLVADEQEFTL